MVCSGDVNKMGALLIALIIGSILVFWNFNSLIESCDKNDGLKNFFNLNIRKDEKGVFLFLFFLFICFFFYGGFSLFLKPDKFLYDVKNYFSDVLLVFLFLSMLINYLIRSFIMGWDSKSKDKKYVWDVWSISVKNYKGERSARVLCFSNMVSLMFFLFFVIAKLMD